MLQCVLGEVSLLPDGLLKFYFVDTTTVTITTDKILYYYFFFIIVIIIYVVKVLVLVLGLGVISIAVNTYAVLGEGLGGVEGMKGKCMDPCEVWCQGT